MVSSREFSKFFNFSSEYKRRKYCHAMKNSVKNLNKLNSEFMKIYTKYGRWYVRKIDNRVELANKGKVKIEFYLSQESDEDLIDIIDIRLVRYDIKY